MGFLFNALPVMEGFFEVAGYNEISKFEACRNIRGAVSALRCDVLGPK
jgi:hypothetical protein